jgi:hypothetical protein
LKTSPYKIIHITTHGLVEGQGKREKFVGLWFWDGHVGKGDIEKLKGKLKGCSLVSNACLSGDAKFGRALVKTAGCDYYVAPNQSPKFHNAIFFAHIFYHKMFISKKSVRTILEEYDDRFRNPHEFDVVSFRDFIKKSLE